MQLCVQKRNCSSIGEPILMCLSVFLPNGRHTQGSSVWSSTLTRICPSTQNRLWRCIGARNVMRCRLTFMPSPRLPTEACCKVHTGRPTKGEGGFTIRQEWAKYNPGGSEGWAWFHCGPQPNFKSLLQASAEMLHSKS